jgi:hypothetical protein
MLTKFMILYMAPVSAETQMNVSPEDMKKGMEPWMAWFKKIGKALVDQGGPLGNGMHFTAKGNSKGQTEVTGYSIVQAENMEAIKKMLTNHPHLMMPKASIEVLEMLPMAM